MGTVQLLTIFLRTLSLYSLPNKYLEAVTQVANHGSGCSEVQRSKTTHKSKLTRYQYTSLDTKNLAIQSSNLEADKHLIPLDKTEPHLETQSHQQQRHPHCLLCISHRANLVKNQTLPVTSHSKHSQLPQSLEKIVQRKNKLRPRSVEICNFLKMYSHHHLGNFSFQCLEFVHSIIFGTFPLGGVREKNKTKQKTKCRSCLQGRRSRAVAETVSLLFSCTFSCLMPTTLL